MKPTFFSLLFGLVGIAACGGAQEAPATSYESPAGDTPAGDTPAGDTPVDDTYEAPEPATTDGLVACDVEVALDCRAPLVDGCLKAVTTHHVCVPPDATAGQPCTTEIALTCEGGLVDACLLSAPPAATHVCVEEGS